jgi:hypothetical protein
MVRNELATGLFANAALAVRISINLKAISDLVKVLEQLKDSVRLGGVEDVAPDTARCRELCLP